MSPAIKNPGPASKSDLAAYVKDERNVQMKRADMNSSGRYRPAAKRIHSMMPDIITRIAMALQNIDQLRASLQTASDDLTSVVNNPDTPEKVRADFQKFWRAGGCNMAQYREWLVGGRPREPVLARRHLRLVTNQKQRWRVRLVRRRLAGPDDGPAAA